MKKNYLYFLLPLVGLLIFGAVYWNFSKSLAEREAKRVAAEKKRKEDKLRQQARDNEKAIQDALVAQAKRKAEREAKEAKDKADKEARALAVEAKEKAYRDANKLTQQVERLEKEIQAEKDAITKLEGDKKRSGDEQAFLREYVKKAEENVRNLSQVMEKIAAADAARAAAEAAAAAAAKKNS